MTFKLADTYRYWWPVAVQLPSSETPGAVVEHTFTMQFEAMRQDDVDAVAEWTASLSPADQKKEQNAIAFRICKDWRDVTDATGEPMPFSQEALKAMLNVPWFATAIYKAYAASLGPRVA